MDASRIKQIKQIKRTLKTVGSIVGFSAGLLSIVGFVLAFIYPNQFGDIVDVIRGSGQEVSASVRETGADTVAAIQSLEETARLLEREVSDDPVRELANRQYTLTHDDFQRALHANDLVSLQLFCSTSATPFVDALGTYFSPSHPHRARISEAAWEIYRTCPVVNFDALCQARPYNHQAMCREDFNRREFAEICGADRTSELLAEVARISSTATHPDDIRFWQGAGCR